MRLLVEARPFGQHPIIGLGDEVRWMAPVRPGDVRMKGEVKDLTPSKTKPQAPCHVMAMYNRHGQAVYEFTPMTIVRRRPET